MPVERMVPSTRGGADYDRRVAMLVVRIGRYPLHAGTIGAIRTMGRVGVAAYSMTEDRFTPAAVSRYAAGRFVAPTRGTESEEQLLELLASLGRRIGRPTIALPTDDEASVFVAEHAHDLAEWFVTPRIEPSLPRRLASKRGLFEICSELGVSTPAATFPTTVAEVDAFAAATTFPIIVKNLAAFQRLRVPIVSRAVIVRSADDLRELAASWPRHFSVILQDYLPEEVSQDWTFQGYFDASSRPLVAFTGQKLRSWPPHAGPTTRAISVANVEIAQLTTNLCRDLGYRGIVDLDWRLDLRDGRYKLLDFNPRVGAHFRLFETDVGIDVVRAMHLDLSGREVPAGNQVDGRCFVLEHLDLPARLAYRHRPLPSGVATIRHREPAFWARDDILPFLAMAARFAGPATARLGQLGTSAVRNRMTHHRV